jgi:biopolymer transport protein ExbD
VKRQGLRGHFTSVVPEINVTPLVDVVLVLLIIFMVVVPQLEREVAVDLPAVRNPDPETRAEVEPLVITLSRDRKLFLGEREMSEAEVSELLSATRASSPDRRLVLRADRNAPWESVRDLLAMLQERGFRGSSLLVNEQSEKKAAGES